MFGWTPGRPSPPERACPHGQGFVVGQGVGALPGSSQHTETHRFPLTTTVAVVVSVVPLPTSVPAAAPPSFWVTPNHGSAPISNAELAGFATMVAVLPDATWAVTDAPVEAAPLLMVTEHQLRKFMTVSVTLPPLPSVAPLSVADAPLSIVDVPLELPLPEPLPELLLEPVPELLPVAPSEVEASSFGVVVGELLLLHATAPATVAIPAIPSHSMRLFLIIVKPPIQKGGGSIPNNSKA
jgi:hypothetical protein